MSDIKVIISVPKFNLFLLYFILIAEFTTSSRKMSSSIKTYGKL